LDTKFPFREEINSPKWPKKDKKQEKQKEQSNMSKRDYIETNEVKFAAQLVKFKTGIPGFAATFNLSAGQVSGQAADCDYYNYLVSGQGIMSGAAQQWVGWRDLIRNGGTPPPTGAPVLPTLPASVAAVDPGVEARFRMLAQIIKSNPNYDPSIGEVLGIEGAHQTAPDMSTIQPDISATIIGAHVMVGWGWQGFGKFLDMIEIKVDRADGKGSVLLAHDTTPGYVDTQPFPATPALWTYTATYMVGDSTVGLTSKPVTIKVGG
jgi:hypothetical protein